MLLPAKHAHPSMLACLSPTAHASNQAVQDSKTRGSAPNAHRCAAGAWLAMVVAYVFALGLAYFVVSAGLDRCLQWCSPPDRPSPP